MFLIRLLRKPLIWLGADYDQLRLIIQTKLTIDFRRGPSMYQSVGKSKQTFGKQLFMYIFLGVFLSFGFFKIDNIMVCYTIAFTVIIVMMATTIISEFTSVLFDDKDNLIILVRPVSNRTLLLSRLLHIQFYVLYIALALSVITIIVTIFKFGIFATLLFLLGVILSTWITLLITTLFYLSLSKFVNGERFKDIITYFQIALAMVVMFGYQFLPRIIEINSLSDAAITIHPWTYLIPPVWLAALVQLSVPGTVNYDIIILALLALIFTTVGAQVTIRFLSKGFGSILSQIPSDNAVIEKDTKTKKKEKKTWSLSKYLCISEPEKSGWNLVMAVTRRDRKFKQAVYPAFGGMIVLAFAMLRPDINNFAHWIQEISTSQKYLTFIFFGFFATTSIVQFQYTDNPEAGWIYRVLPIKTPGHILSGAIKAMLIKFFIPMYTVLSITVLLIWGIKLLPTMILGAVLTITSTIVTLNLQNTSLPFTQAREMQQKGSNFLKTMLGMLTMGFVVLLVFLASYLPNWTIIIVSVGVLFLNSVAFKFIREIKFKFTD